jgi:hypothetical protein
LNPPGFSTPLHELTSARVSANCVGRHKRVGFPTLSFFEGGAGNVESQESQHRSAPPPFKCDWDYLSEAKGAPPSVFLRVGLVTWNHKSPNIEALLLLSNATGTI